MNSPDQQSAKSVVLIPKPNLRTLAKQLLRERGYDVIASADSIEAVEEALQSFPQALLVIDFDIGLERTNDAFRRAQSYDSLQARPTLLLAGQVSQSLLTVASDFQITRLAIGEITLTTLGSHLDAVSAEREVNHRQKLREIASFRRRGDMIRTGELLMELQAKNPSDQRVNEDLIDYLLTTEKWDEAQAVLDTVVASYGSSSRLMQFKARMLMRQGNMTEAINLLEESHIANPFHVDRLLDLGQALLAANRHQEAISYFNQALAIDQNNRQARDGKVTCHLVSDDINEALDLLRGAASAREIAAIFNTAAVITTRSGQIAQGIKLYETAIAVLGKRDPVVARLLFNLGLAYCKNHKKDKAATAFRLALQIDRTFSKAGHYLNRISREHDTPQYEAITHL